MTRIRHLDGKRVITIHADVDTKKITSIKTNQLLAEEFKNIPKTYPGYGYKIRRRTGGECQDDT